MPVRTENKHRYSAEWKEIRAAILKRAKNRCEFCGTWNDALGYWGDDGTLMRVPAYVTITPGIYWRNGKWRKVIRIVLTVAHLDHRPENNDPSNLRALCQRCHNRHDAKMRAEGRKARRSTP